MQKFVIIWWPNYNNTRFPLTFNCKQKWLVKWILVLGSQRLANFHEDVNLCDYKKEYHSTKFCLCNDSNDISACAQDSHDQTHIIYQPLSNIIAVFILQSKLTGGNRTMVSAATIVIMAAADGERISIFPLVCPDKAHSVSFSAPDI